MLKISITAAGILLAMVAGSISATAGSEGYREGRYQDRDCAPVNGRNGFYGNIWCEGWEGQEGRELELTLPWWSSDRQPVGERTRRQIIRE